MHTLEQEAYPKRPTTTRKWCMHVRILLCHQKQAMVAHCTKESESIGYDGGTVHHLHVLDTCHSKAIVGSPLRAHSQHSTSTLTPGARHTTSSMARAQLRVTLHCVTGGNLNLVLH